MHSFVSGRGRRFADCNRCRDATERACDRCESAIGVRVEIPSAQKDAQSGETDGETQPEARPSRNARREGAVLLLSSWRAPLAVVPLPASGSLTIGRDAGAELPAGQDAAAGDVALRLPDRLLSRAHLRISRVLRGYEVLDLQSRNGSFLDGPRLTRGKRLSSGSILLCGNQVAVFRDVRRDALEALRQEAASPFGPVPTASPALALQLARLRKLARTGAELLLVGETGVGKEICARAIHAASGRSGAFRAINCASVPAALIESELFGYAAGAHSTARAAKPGLVEMAEGGTLLLDEIGDMAPDLQAKIFRFLQDRTVTPLGSTRSRRADVRVIAATTRLRVGGGPEALRGDLVARLGADPIVIPPLRERPEEVPALAAHFAGEAAPAIEPAALRALCLYGWPLNVRELEKAIKSAVAIADGGVLRLEHLPGAVRGGLEHGAPVGVRRRARPGPDRGALEQLLDKHGGNVASVARKLDRHWTVVGRWVAHHGLKPKVSAKPKLSTKKKRPR